MLWSYKINMKEGSFLLSRSIQNLNPKLLLARGEQWLRPEFKQKLQCCCSDLCSDLCRMAQSHGFWTAIYWLETFSDQLELSINQVTHLACMLGGCRNLETPCMQEYCFRHVNPDFFEWDLQIKIRNLQHNKGVKHARGGHKAVDIQLYSSPCWV